MSTRPKQTLAVSGAKYSGVGVGGGKGDVFKNDNVSPLLQHINSLGAPNVMLGRQLLPSNSSAAPSLQGVRKVGAGNGLDSGNGNGSGMSDDNNTGNSMPGTARTMRRMEKITGRSDDMMILRGVNVFPTQIEEQVLKIPALAPYFQIERYKTGPMETMRVLVETKSANMDATARASCQAALEQGIKTIVGISTDVVVGDVGSVPRSQGKAVRVVDRRGEG